MALNSKRQVPSDGFGWYMNFNSKMKFRSLLANETHEEHNSTSHSSTDHDDSEHSEHEMDDCDSYLDAEDETLVKYLDYLYELEKENITQCYEYDEDDNQYTVNMTMTGYSCHTTEEGAEYAHKIYKIFENHYITCSEHEHTAWGIYLILYTAFVLFLGCVFKWISQRFRIPIPYTVLLLLLGIFFEAWEILETNSWGDLRNGFNDLRKIDPHMILNLFIPGLIFESAFNTNFHIFQKEREQALMLAGPGVVVNLILIGGAMHYFAWFYDWTWSFCFMFGSIVSATDPVAVVALLKELGASKRLSTLIEAESLLNDGTAFVLFTVFQNYAASPADTTFSTVIISLLQLAFGGVACGVVFGVLTYRALLYVFNDFQIEITFTLSMCYLAFYTAENVLGVSGVLTVVFMGLWVSKNKQAVSPLVEETMHHFWEMVGFIANTVLFFVTGQVIAYRLISGDDYTYKDFLILFILYIMCHIIRALGIWQMFPALESVGYGCTWKDAVVMVYGGLRGAIGLALALIVDLEDEFSQINRDRVLFHVSGIVLLTLVVNATTIGWIVGQLGLNKPAKDTAALFKSATDFLEDHIHHALSKMKLDKHYHGANWTKVEDLQPNYQDLVDEIFGTLDEDEKQEVLALTGDDSEEGSEHHIGTKASKGDISSPLVVDMLLALGAAQKEAGERREIEKRLIQVMKSSYWSQYERGLISSDAVHVLTEAAESAMDDHNLEIQYKVLKKFFTIPKYVQKMHTAHVCGQYGKKVLKGIAERLLFSNLGFAVELASGFIYASKQARDFSQMLIKNAGVKTAMVESTIRQLDVATQFIAKNLSNIEKVYPEVHQAIQTSHAAHALLHHQKHEIESLLHQGVLDDAECDRVMSLCDEALNNLFHTGYSEYIKDLDDINTLLNSPLFSELTDIEKGLVKQKAVASQWYDKGNQIIQAGRRSKGLFVITRGTVDVFGIQDEVERKRTLSGGFSGNETFGAALYTKQRGECIDIWPLLEDRAHTHSFIVTSEKCHGFWLNFELLHLLKESNIDFWDTLWKIAAVDVIRYYYQESKVFSNFDFNNVESGVFGSPLSYYDGEYDGMRQIRIARGFGILLNGTIVKVSDATQTAEAPAIITASAAQDYVAVNECVVLTLDVNRNKLTSMESNAKLAKLFGVPKKLRGKSGVAKSAASPEPMSDDESISGSYSGSMSITGDESDNNDEKDGKDNKDNKDDKDDNDNDGGNGGGSDNEREKAKEKEVGKGVMNETDEFVQTTKMLTSPSQIEAAKKHSRKHKAQQSSYQDVNFDLVMDESRLPVDVRDNYQNWTDEECWNVLKHLIHKHEGMFEHLRKFHIHHVTKEVQSHLRHKQKKQGHNHRSQNENEVEFDDTENLQDTPEPPGPDGKADGVTYVALNNGSSQQGIGTRPLKKGSKWARPSMGPNAIKKAQAAIAQVQGIEMESKSKDRGSTLKKGQYRSSRFLAQQQEHENDAIMNAVVNSQNDSYQAPDGGAGTGGAGGVIVSKTFKKQNKLLHKHKKDEKQHESGIPENETMNTQLNQANSSVQANVKKQDTGSVDEQLEADWVAADNDNAPDVRTFN